MKAFYNLLEHKMSSVEITDSDLLELRAAANAAERTVDNLRAPRLKKLKLTPEKYRTLDAKTQACIDQIDESVRQFFGPTHPLWSEIARMLERNEDLSPVFRVIHSLHAASQIVPSVADFQVTATVDADKTTAIIAQIKTYKPISDLEAKINLFQRNSSVPIEVRALMGQKSLEIVADLYIRAIRKLYCIYEVETEDNLVLDVGVTQAYIAAVVERMPDSLIEPRQKLEIQLKRMLLQLLWLIETQRLESLIPELLAMSTKTYGLSKDSTLADLSDANFSDLLRHLTWIHTQNWNGQVALASRDNATIEFLIAEIAAMEQTH